MDAASQAPELEPPIVADQGSDTSYETDLSLYKIIRGNTTPTWKKQTTELTWDITSQFRVSSVLSSSFKATTERGSWPCSTPWTGPSCARTTAPLQTISWPEWSCRAFPTPPTSTTSSSWPYRTSCPCCWCSASPTRPSTSCGQWCRRRRESSRCVCASY